jgi:hypothetical protein
MLQRTMDSASKAARELGKRSAAARRLKLGEEEFRKRMQQLGKKGGRPKGKGRGK